MFLLDGGEESLYDAVKSSAYAIQISIGLPGLIMYMVLVWLLIKFLLMYFKRFLVVAILTFMAPIIGVTYSIDKIKDNKSQSLGNWLREYTFNVIIQSVHALLYTLFIGLAFEMSGKSIYGAAIAILLMNFMLKAEGIFKKIFGIKSKSLKDAIKSALAITKGREAIAKYFKANAKVLGVVSKPVTSQVKNIAGKTKQYRRSDKVEKTKNAIEKAIREGKTTVDVGKYNFNISSIINDKENINSDHLASDLVGKAEEIDASKRAYKIESMIETLNTVLAARDAAVSIPAMIIDGKAGFTMASKAKLRLKQGIKGDSADEENNKKNRKYTGKLAGIKDLMTAGLYSNSKVINGKNKDFVKGLNKSAQNAQYEILIKNLEKKIATQRKDLEKTLGTEELENVLEAAYANVEDGEVKDVLYFAQAYMNTEIKVNINIDIEVREKINEIAKEAITIKEISDTMLENNVCKYVEQANSDVDNDGNIKVKETEFRKYLEKEIKKNISKNRKEEQKGKKITNKEIETALKNMDNNDKAILIEKALKKSAIKTNKLSVKNELDKIMKETKDIDAVLNKIENMSKNKKVKMDNKKFKSKVEAQLVERVSKMQDKRKKDVTDKEIEEIFKGINSEERQEIIEKAIYESVEISEEVIENIKEEKLKMSIEDVDTVINMMQEGLDVDINQQNYKDNFKDIIETRIKEEWKIKEDKINTDVVNSYIGGLSNEDLIIAIKTAGARRNSIERDKNSGKAEYAPILDDIEKLNYYKAQMKG